MALTPALSCVAITPSEHRPSYDPSEESGDKDLFLVVSVGQAFCYPIPSFEVLAVEMRPVCIQGCTESGQIHTYDVFIREDTSVAKLSGPTWLTVLDWVVIDPAEFSKSVKIDGFKLPPQGVFIVWEWEWKNDVDTDSNGSAEASLSTYCSADGDINPYLESECGSEHSASDNETSFSLPEVTHTITFKCMGTTYHTESQDALRKISDLQKSGKGLDVPVKLEKEPQNPYDAQAIMFQCKIEDTWVRIGYVVKEALPSVHKALDDNKIINVKFDWVKYLIFKSGPGYYAGIVMENGLRKYVTVKAIVSDSFIDHVAITSFL